MTPEEREAELLKLLENHQVHNMAEVYSLDDTCLAVEWDRLASGLKQRNVVDYLWSSKTIRLL
jgi:hypothetical protein